MTRCLPRLRVAHFAAFTASLATALLAPGAFANPIATTQAPHISTTQSPESTPPVGQIPQAAVIAPSAPGAMRNFPASALRGTLLVSTMYDAKIGDKAVRMAPGVRLFSPQNSLIQAHTVIGKPLTVNYVMEASTGMLLTAWVLSQSEAAEKRKTQ